MKVAVLGCGPAGLIAAEAVRHHAKRSTKIEIFSNKVKSVMPGAQYLHAPIPEVSPEQPIGALRYVKLGSKHGYAAKVYGDAGAPVSWDLYDEGTVMAWSIHETYDRLWERWEDRIEDVGNLNGCSDTLRYIADRYDLVLSTIPASLWCDRIGHHQFDMQSVWIADGAQSGTGENTIIYNGDPKVPWYRSSNIFGHASTEYSVPVVGGKEGRKPLKTDCTCPPPNVTRTGRFGKWDKRALVHVSYPEARRALLALQ